VGFFFQINHGCIPILFDGVQVNIRMDELVEMAKQQHWLKVNG
jgi:hypothetical protein